MFSNVTGPAIQSAEYLYRNTDPSKLNLLENLWMQWYLYFGDPTIATGVMSFCLHEVR